MTTTMAGQVNKYGVYQDTPITQTSTPSPPIASSPTPSYVVINTGTSSVQLPASKVSQIQSQSTPNLNIFTPQQQSQTTTTLPNIFPSQSPYVPPAASGVPTIFPQQSPYVYQPTPTVIDTGISSVQLPRPSMIPQPTPTPMTEVGAIPISQLSQLDRGIITQYGAGWGNLSYTKPTPIEDRATFGVNFPEYTKRVFGETTEQQQAYFDTKVNTLNTLSMGVSGIVSQTNILKNQSLSLNLTDEKKAKLDRDIADYKQNPSDTKFEIVSREVDDWNDKVEAQKLLKSQNDLLNIEYEKKYGEYVKQYTDYQTDVERQHLGVEQATLYQQIIPPSLKSPSPENDFLGYSQYSQEGLKYRVGYGIKSLIDPVLGAGGVIAEASITGYADILAPLVGKQKPLFNLEKAYERGIASGETLAPYTMGTPLAPIGYSVTAGNVLLAQTPEQTMEAAIPFLFGGGLKLLGETGSIIKAAEGTGITTKLAKYGAEVLEKAGPVVGLGAGGAYYFGTPEIEFANTRLRETEGALPPIFSAIEMGDFEKAHLLEQKMGRETGGFAFGYTAIDPFLSQEKFINKFYSKPEFQSSSPLTEVKEYSPYKSSAHINELGEVQYIDTLGVERFGKEIFGPVERDIGGLKVTSAEELPFWRMSEKQLIASEGTPGTMTREFMGMPDFHTIESPARMYGDRTIFTLMTPGKMTIPGIEMFSRQEILGKEGTFKMNDVIRDVEFVPRGRSSIIEVPYEESLSPFFKGGEDVMGTKYFESKTANDILIGKQTEFKRLPAKKSLINEQKINVPGMELNIVEYSAKPKLDSYIQTFKEPKEFPISNFRIPDITEVRVLGETPSSFIKRDTVLGGKKYNIGEAGEIFPKVYSESLLISDIGIKKTKGVFTTTEPRKISARVSKNIYQEELIPKEKAPSPPIEKGLPDIIQGLDASTFIGKKSGTTNYLEKMAKNITEGKSVNKDYLRGFEEKAMETPKETTPTIEKGTVFDQTKGREQTVTKTREQQKTLSQQSAMEMAQRIGGTTQLPLSVMGGMGARQTMSFAMPIMGGQTRTQERSSYIPQLQKQSSMLSEKQIMNQMEKMAPSGSLTKMAVLQDMTTSTKQQPDMMNLMKLGEETKQDIIQIPKMDEMILEKQQPLTIEKQKQIEITKVPSIEKIPPIAMIDLIPIKGFGGFGTPVGGTLKDEPGSRGFDFVYPQKTRKTKPLFQIKSDYFRKFVTGEKDILATPENIKMVKGIWSKEGSLLGIIPTREQLARKREKNKKLDLGIFNDTGGHKKSFKNFNSF